MHIKNLPPNTAFVCEHPKNQETLNSIFKYMKAFSVFISTYYTMGKMQLKAEHFRRTLFKKYFFYLLFIPILFLVNVFC